MQVAERCRHVIVRSSIQQPDTAVHAESAILEWARVIYVVFPETRLHFDGHADGVLAGLGYRTAPFAADDAAKAIGGIDQQGEDLVHLPADAMAPVIDQLPGHAMGHFSQYDAAKARIDKIIWRRRLVFGKCLPDIAAGESSRYGLPEGVPVAPESVEEKAAVKRMTYLIGLKSVIVPCPVGRL